MNQRKSKEDYPNPNCFSCCRTNIYSQKSPSLHPRKSPPNFWCAPAGPGLGKDALRLARDVRLARRLEVLRAVLLEVLVRELGLEVVLGEDEVARLDDEILDFTDQRDRHRDYIHLRGQTEVVVTRSNPTILSILLQLNPTYKPEW